MQTGDMAGEFTHRFSTKPWCSVTGLCEYQMRKYRPEIGRWLSRDPIGETDEFNLMLFVNNDSAYYIDDIGLRRRKRGRRTGRLLGNLAGAHRFIWHFYIGFGAPVDIGSWGYLEHYRSASDVIKFECEARNKVRASIDNCCANDGTTWEGSYGRPVDGTDGLYVMGRGLPSAQWTCFMVKRKVVCAVSFSIKDRFEDPLDIDSAINRRLPNWMPRIPAAVVNLGGTPYDLTASWDYFIDGCSDPEACGTGSNRDRRRGIR